MAYIIDFKEIKKTLLKGYIQEQIHLATIFLCQLMNYSWFLI